MSLPVRRLSARYVVAFTVAMVVGAGIFKSPALVATYAGSEQMVYLLWLAGGLISLAGALCYAELSSAFAHPGGDYHFLERAFGPEFAFLFAWARLAIINTGAIALLGFVIGDYLNLIVDLGTNGPAIYAFASVFLLNGFKLLFHAGRADIGMVLLLVMGLMALVAAGVSFELGHLPSSDPAGAGGITVSGAGYGLVFVLLAFGGWTEAATLSGEVRDGERAMLRALIVSITLITGLYLLVNWAMLRGLGLSGLSASSAPAADLMMRAFGWEAGLVLALVVTAAAVTSVNATIIAGARTVYAGAARYPALSWISRWHEGISGPRNAILLQAAISLLLTVLAAFLQGFQTLVDYTAPVYWLFLIASGVALMRLRKTERDTRRPFRVPAYPFLPILFILSSSAMLVSALFYVRAGAFFGLFILLAGVFVYRMIRPERD